jgi:hypothetical protein
MLFILFFMNCDEYYFIIIIIIIFCVIHNIQFMRKTILEGSSKLFFNVIEFGNFFLSAFQYFH